jgi:AcrR family transcriptional regulator
VEKSTDKVSNEKRAEILFAALSLFGQKGFDRTTVDEIANKANVGKGTVYLYFDNKDQIIMAILESGLSKLNSLFTEVSEIPDYIQKIRTIISNHLHFVEEHQEFYRLFIKEGFNFRFIKDEVANQTIFNKHKQLHQSVKDFFQKGIDQGHLLKGEADDYAITIAGILNHFAFHWIMRKPDYPLTGKTDVILNLLLSGIVKRRAYERQSK